MKKFDFDRMKKYIEKNDESIESIQIGMLEDFWWTGNDYYKNKLYLVVPEYCIFESNWATPIMLVTFNNGKKIIIDSYIDNGVKEKTSKLLIELLISGVATKDTTTYLSLLERTTLDEVLNG